MGDLADLLHRVGPIAVFLVTITVTAEVAERAGVFDVAGHGLARLCRGRLWPLWLLFALLATACTVALSLDTTAVLLTPVGLAIARQIGASPVPFALTTLWLANTGSLLLPVSNLTNLLALHRLESLGVDHTDYLVLMWRPALAAVVVTIALLAVLHRTRLRGRYDVSPPADPHDRVLLLVSAAVCLAVGPLFAAGLEPAIVASAAAAVSLACAAWRAPGLLPGLRPPWLMAIGFVVVAGLVTWLGQAGLDAWWESVLPDGEGVGALLGVAGIGAVTANVLNNLPAYLTLEAAAGTEPLRLLALLIGVNAGPLVTPWASLATLLWLERCRAAGVRVPPLRLAAAGLACAVLTTLAAVLALATT